MALTPEQRARLDALTAGTVKTAPSALSDEQRARLSGYSGAPAPAVQAKPEEKGALYRAASFVNRGVEGFANLPVIKQIGQATGAAIGGPSALIGGAVAAVGTPVANIISGKPLSRAFEGTWQNVKRNAVDTGKFGYGLGEQAPTLAAMQTLGRVPNLAIGASQAAEGYRQTRDAMASGDTAGAIQAGITTGIGAVGTILGARQKGLIVDEGFSQGVKARVKGVPVNELNIAKYEGVMQDVLQPNKSAVKRETKGILAQARKERAGMSVEPRKTTARVLVEEGVVPNTVDEGGATKFRTAEQVVDMDNRVAYANDKLEEALALDPNPQFDLAAKKTEAVRSVDSIQNISATEKKAMKAEIERFFDDEIEARGQFVDGSQYNQIKRGFANSGDYKNLTPGQKHIRQVAESIAKDIEERYADKFDVKGVNRTIGDYIQARNELQALDGSVVKGGGLSRKLAQLGGAIAAGPLSRIPLVDNIIGGYVAGKAQAYAVSPARKLSGMQSADIRSPAIDVLSSAEEGSRAAAVRQSALPRLPAPRTPLPGALDQYVPSGSRLFSQEEAAAALRGTAMDPTRVGGTAVVSAPGYLSPFYGQKPLALPAPGKSSVITLPSRVPQEAVPAASYRFPPSPQPKSVEQMRLETLQDVANSADPVSSSPLPYRNMDPTIRTMSQDIPPEAVRSPDFLRPRQVDGPQSVAEVPMTEKEYVQLRRAEAYAMQEQLRSFSYPVPEMEDAYKAFKQLADRSESILDDALDAEGFVKRYGKDKSRVIIENAVRGGGMTNNEVLDAYRVRYRTEKLIKSRISNAIVR